MAEGPMKQQMQMITEYLSSSQSQIKQQQPGELTNL